MRVAIVAGPHYPVPPAKYGGTELVIHYLVKGLLEAGHEPILLAPGDSKVDCELIPICDSSIEFPKTPRQIKTHEAHVRKILQGTRVKLRKLIKDKRIDIIHSHGFDLKSFQGFPCLTTIHGKIDFEDLPYYLKRQKLYYASISSNQQKPLPNLQFIGMVYNGEDPQEFPIVTKPEDYVCFLGRFDRDKNPHLAIQLAINAGLKIKVAGKIDFRGYEYFKEELKDLLEHPLVDYLGELDFAAKIELLSRAKCNLHPSSFREPFGLTVLEAAYCGTPTLATARGSMPELIEEGRTGVLVEDFIEGYHAIESCFAMDRRYIATRARMLFNYRTMTEQYMKAYEQVIRLHEIRKSHEEAILDVAKQTQSELENIWRSRK